MRRAGGDRLRSIVVGAGVSGAFAADTLRRRVGPGLHIDVLERDNRIGGRAFRRPVSGVEVETGASLFHSSNRLMCRGARDLGLEIVQAGSAGTLGIWDGTQLRLRTRGHPRVDALHLLVRYRLAILRAGRQVAGLVRKLEAGYSPLERGDSWDHPEQFWRILGLYELSQRRAGEQLPSGRFLTEFVDGVSRNNYAQDATELNALAELVSLAGAGLGGGSLLRVAEGNAAIPAGLLTRSQAHLRTAATVRRIEPHATGWRVTGDGLPPLQADMVLLSAPLEISGIELLGAPVPAPRTFQTVHVTFVVGSLRQGAFDGSGTTPAFTLTTAAAHSLLSIQRVAHTAHGGLYKIFSKEELTDEVVHRFLDAVDITRMRWLAYPRLPPTPAAPGFRLARGLYYTGAMEYAVSTMETQAIAGVATANLAARDLL